MLVGHAITVVAVVEVVVVALEAVVEVALALLG